VGARAVNIRATPRGARRHLAGYERTYRFDGNDEFLEMSEMANGLDHMRRADRLHFAGTLRRNRC